MDEFRKRLKKELETRRITQRYLAQITGLTEVSMSRYITGDRVPKANVLLKICKALHVSPDYLLGWEDEEKTRFGATNGKSVDFGKMEVENGD